MNLLVMCLLFLQVYSISAFMISGRINENTTFFYRVFQTCPSKLVTMEYNVTYKKYPLVNFPVSLKIYTTQNHSDLQTKCIGSHYGQLRNEEFWIPLGPRLKPYKQTKCVEKYQEIHYSGKITIQDYISKKLAFSVGYQCRKRNAFSVEGLAFKFMITDQSNSTNCIKTNNIFSGFFKYNYDYTSSVNLIGIDFDLMKEISMQLTRFGPLLDGDLMSCYKHFYEVLFYVLIPKCDPQSKIITHACKDACQDFRNACRDQLFYLLRHKRIKWFPKKEEKDITDTLISFMNCNYLPSKSCFYKPVSCGVPPNVPNAWATNGSYNVTSTIEYSCQDERFHIEGNKTIECLFSGNWTKPPRCMKREKSTSPLFIVLPLLVGSIFVYFVGLLIVRCKNRKQQIHLIRTKDYDAFVCYAYEGNDLQFAEETVRIQLEEEHQFKLCIHRRDFLAAWDIMWNINNAIKNSNSAIIVMSQDYINSLWCKEEFEQCYFEHMKDPAFKLFVIMMQPVEDLEHISVYMEKFFSQKTYLLKDDPAIFKKIATYLSWVKETKENPVKTRKSSCVNARDIPPAVLVSTPSVVLTGYPPPPDWVPPRGGYLDPPRGVPDRVPPLGGTRTPPGGT